MPSPFLGFDPYLEAPDIWPDLHNALTNEISTELNRTLPPPFYARLNAVELAVTVEPIRHSFVEIRQPSRAHRLITLIEIVSPSNKQPGADRCAYQQKQREILDSDASLVEIDLLRSGQRLFPENTNLEELVSKLDPQPDYLVTINRAWRRIGDLLDYQLFPIGVRESLPCIPVPLTKHRSEPALDLQWVFNQAYDRGPYRRGAIDYNQPPPPPLAENDLEWARQVLAAR